ncbi:ring finger protein, putative [Rhizoctonia solani AG-3 Rhs1AP]|uniref:RBR-type E3 ubiquitin transferase n=1 Tax=Rhizoctonia solani AG-3 Rhs1AP TaxID=1086054 RepID=X8J3Q8_9AGAM|nr:ring finger protein, putative [Rhizoctonia solani AG-3 Rhs1AP]
MNKDREEPREFGIQFKSLKRYRCSTPEGGPNHHTDTAQYVKFHPALNRKSIYLIRDRTTSANPSLTSEQAPPVPPKDRRFAMNPPNRLLAPSQSAGFQNSAPTCSICFEDTNHFPRRAPTSRCAHPPAICAPCLEEYISHSVLTDGLTSIPCPTPECEQTLGYDDVIRGAKSDKICLDRYETLLLRRLLEHDPNFAWCKNPACSWGQIHEGGDENPLVICEQCYTHSCFTHDIPWHTGFTCRQFDVNLKMEAESRRLKEQRDDENRESEEYIRNHAKKCPSCGRQIQKNGGCNHMTCHSPAGCGHQFCWLCLAHWGQPHKPPCEYYYPRSANTSPYAYSGVFYDD